MSHILDNEKFYEYYTIVKNVYAYTHLNPYIKEFNPDMVEKYFVSVVFVTGLFSIIFVIIKFLLVFIYFFVIRLFLNLKDFVISLVKTKGRYPYLTGFKNGILYLAKNGKKIYTYNFYLYDKIPYGIFFFLCYFSFLIATFFFLFYIKKETAIYNKSNSFYVFHVFCFHLNLFLEILCTTFYSIRNFSKQILLSIGYILILNGFVFLAYFFNRSLMNDYGSLDLLSRILNIIIYGFLLILHCYTFISVISYDKRSKSYKINLIFF
ncbi:MAG: hypothetical protein MJ252_18315 [archaeon]|nr:hypothetical protein [archaeon]